MSITIQAQRSRASSTPARLPRAIIGRIISRLRTLKGQFIFQAGLLFLLAGFLTMAGAIALSRATNDLNTIDSGSIPSVDAAQQITQLIETMDAQSADFLATAGLTATAPCTITGLAGVQQLTVHACDERNIDAETVLVNQQLFAAAHNVTYTGERTAVERITIGLESYLGDIHQMRVDFALAKSKTDPADLSLQQAYQAYMNASSILHNQISLATITSGQIPFATEDNVPSCFTSIGQTLAPAQWTRGGLTVALDCLSSINYSQLNSAYKDSAGFLLGATWLVGVLCVIFCGMLLFSIVKMMTTTHRMINPGLVAAALLALILSFNIVSLLATLGATSKYPIQDGTFRQMVQDDYQSIYDAALLKRYGTDANADESRWLIAQEFKDQASIDHWQNDWNRNIQQVGTLIQHADANQTWDEEVQPLSDIDAYWKQYTGLDGQIRAQAQNPNDSRRLLTAEVTSTGPSNQAFNKFTDAVGRLADANREHYTRTLKDANNALFLSFMLCLVLVPLAGLLAVWGIAMRLKDF